MKELFRAAPAWEPGGRAEFLARACAGRDSLRREVESLTASHEGAGSSMGGGGERDFETGWETRPRKITSPAAGAP